MDNRSIGTQLLMLDRELALERVGGDKQLLQEVARLFLDDYPRLMTEIRGAIDAGDSRRLEREAHSLKGSVANFGADPVVKTALSLEMMGRLGDLSNAIESYEKLSGHLDRLQPELLKLAAE